MTKKLLAVVLSLTCLLGLAACGDKGEAEKETAVPYEASVVTDLVTAGAFSEDLEELDTDTAYALYKLGDAQIDRGDLTDSAVLRSSGATCEEAALLVFSDASTAQSAKNAMDGYVQSQIEANKDYRPDDVPKLESATVSCVDNTLLLVVANDQSAVDSVLK